MGVTPERAWLVKSEPDVFSFADLQAAPAATTPWDGVRNHQARNFMRDAMRVGDPVLFYHSNAAPPAVVGVARVASAPYPDASQFDPASRYYDPTSDPRAPRWVLVDIAAVAAIPQVTLATLRDDPLLAALDLALLRRANRLSVMPIPGAAFVRILALAGVTSEEVGWYPERP
jgi:predicted RNA-binding protein with PUA-like domain